MKNFNLSFPKFVVFLSFLFLFISCEKEESPEIISNPKNELFLKYQLLNVNDDAVYETHSSQISRKSSAWLVGGDGDAQVWLRKEIGFSMEDENFADLTFNILVQGGEKDSTLIDLRDHNFNYWKRNWDYKTTANEIENFYKRENFLINIGNGYLLEPSSLELKRAQKAVDQGVEKTYVEIQFSGKAYGFYDGYKEHKAFFIKEGYFAGIIE